MEVCAIQIDKFVIIIIIIIIDHLVILSHFLAKLKNSVDSPHIPGPNLDTENCVEFFVEFYNCTILVFSYISATFSVVL